MLFLVVISLHLLSLGHGHDPMENPGLFEGDMILTKEQEHEFLYGKGPNPDIPLSATIGRQWPKVIPYEYSPEIASDPRSVSLIQAAIRDYEQYTCLRFKERTGETGHIYFYRGGGCSSPVGYRGGRNSISLAYGCRVKGIIMHEMAHSLGFYHEQSRPDRDHYVKILWGNIQSGLGYNFRKQSASNIDSMNVPYDFRSVMHYGGYAFSTGGRTIQTHDPAMQRVIGQRSGFSPLDILQMNLLYGCPGVTKPPKYTLPPLPTTLPTQKVTYPPLPKGKFVSVYISSEGCNDRPKTRGYPCGKARIIIDDIDYSPSKRGHNFVVVDSKTGKVIKTASFDTHGDSSSSTKLVNFVNSLPQNTAVLVAVQDEGSRQLTDSAINTLKQLGSAVKIQRYFRESYALAGYKGSYLPAWVASETKDPGRGPSKVKAYIPLEEVVLESIKLHIHSEGCDDKSVDNKRRHCGTARIEINNRDVSLHGRGVNIVVLSYETGRMINRATFDTHGQSSAAVALATFINAIPPDSIVALAVQDEASHRIGMALKSLSKIKGAQGYIPRFRGSFAVLGYLGQRNVNWTKSAQAPRYRGPSVIDATIKLNVSSGITTLPPEPATTAPAPPTPPVPSANPESCGISPFPHSRVIGGSEAKPGAWPWQIALKKHNYFICGGSLINSQWIVTASHCIGSLDRRIYTVIVGDHNNLKDEGTEQEVKVAKVFKHPKYHSGARFNNDIALMKLARPVMLNKRVSPVCLPNKANKVPVGTNCYITGWGKIKHPGGSHHVLQEAIMPVRGKAECAERLKKTSTSLKITDQMLCAGHLGTSTKISGCHGDSGGPYVCASSTGRYELHGVVSWGSASCDIQEKFTVFARITEMRDWIDEIIRKY